MKFFPLILLFLLVYLFTYFFGFEYLKWESIQKFQELIQLSLGKAIIVFISIYIVYAIASIPGLLFLDVVAGIIFGQYLGFLLAWLSAVTGATIVFLTARYAFTSHTDNRFSRFLIKIQDGLNKHKANYLLFIRLFPCMPFGLVNITLGALRINLLTFLWTTLVGIFPVSFLYTHAGRGISHIINQNSQISLTNLMNRNVIISLVGLSVLSLLPILVRKAISKIEINKGLRYSNTMYSLRKIADWLGIKCERHLPISSFAIDSREVERGGLFFALKGEKVDGHDYLSEIARKGAFAAVVDKDYKGEHFGLFLFFVEDVVVALQDIARKALLERKTKIIGITGSIGKTTTKEFLYEILKGKFRVQKTFGNRNSQRTLPLAILNAKGDEEFLILEMSMTEKGHIQNLVKMAPPTIVVLTPIVACHAKYFQNLDEIAEAKMEIFTNTAEFAVIHEKSAKYAAVVEGCLCDHVIYPKDLPFVSPFPESHMTENVSAAIEVGKYLGMQVEEMAIAAKRLKPYEHRFERKFMRGITFIDDSYNANATSMIAALQNLPKPIEGKKTIAVLGSMMDLGKYSFVSHTEVAKEALNHVDILYCIGEESMPMVDVFKKKERSVQFFTCYEELKIALHQIADEGDVVLIKGSNFHKLWKVLT